MDLSKPLAYRMSPKTLDDYEIFTGVIEDIGFDSKGNDTKSPDWLEVADAFKSFIDKEGW